MSTDAQINANRENAQHSTGPRTGEGKAKSSLNAVKTGLTGRTVLLPGDDVEAYQRHIASVEAQYSPVTDAERLLVQSVADAEWRIARIPSLEAGIYALGRMELAAQFAAADESLRNALIEAKTYLVYHRPLNNLTVQENRLRRQREKDLAQLKQLQQERLAARKERFEEAVISYYRQRVQDKVFDFSAIGFEFSENEFLKEIATWDPVRRGRESRFLKEEERLTQTMSQSPDRPLPSKAA